MNEAQELLRKTPLLQYLTASCKQMMLNPYEIVTWFLFLKKQEYNAKSTERLILYSAYLAKELLNPPDKIEHFTRYF